ncbi:L,D-transpeptidase [Roseivivax sp. CAU 1761]
MAAWPAAAHTLDAQIQEAALPEDMQPRMVNLGLGLAPYEIHVDPVVFALFWTQPDGWAWRYPVGIGREGLYESGEFFVGAKKEWPSWTPTPDMIEREPDKYKQYEDGMPGGLENPLGSRALYLFTEEKGDTFLRIHGTNDPSTIGKRVSNGCARLTNDQIIDLYNRVPENTRVVLYPTM